MIKQAKNKKVSVGFYNLWCENDIIINATVQLPDNEHRYFVDTIDVAAFLYVLAEFDDCQI